MGTFSSRAKPRRLGWKSNYKILEHVKSTDPADIPDHQSSGQTKARGHKTKETLSAYLKSSSATTSQVKKFLATACWLTANGSEHLVTGDITKALSDHRQGKLANASDALNKNVTKGLCEKDGKQFYVTEQGFTSSGRRMDRGLVRPTHSRHSRLV